MVSSLLLRGMLVGLLAGVLLFAFGRYFGEPLIDRAITFEVSRGDAAAAHAEHRAGPHGAAHGEGAQDSAGTHEHTGAHESAGTHEGIAGTSAHRDDEELVSRPVQAGLGLFTGVIVYSTALGGLFALAFAAVHQRLVAGGPRATSALLALAGFVSIHLIPTLKYPANPPAVGEPETIGYRTALYFLMIACSLAAMIGAAVLRKRLAARFGDWTAGYAALGFYLAAMLMVGTGLPSVHEVPDGFPAAVLWQFRVASSGMQLLMWATLGLGFGALTERAWARDRTRHGRTPDFLTAS